MKFWQALSFTETEQLVSLSRTAESAGFHGVLLSDHVFVPEKIASRYPYSEDGRPPFGPDAEFPEPFAAICAMAAVTTRLRFNTAVYLATLRHPLEVAKSVATAAVISGGRVALGVGVGWIREEYAGLGRDFATRGRRLDEMIEVLRKVWAGGMVEHHGTHYDFERCQLSPAPPGPVPIYVGGASPPALRRAARLGDGWMHAGGDAAALDRYLARLAELRSEYGRERAPFRIYVISLDAYTLDGIKRLEDKGVTDVIVGFRNAYQADTMTVEQKIAALEGYADSIIAKAA